MKNTTKTLLKADQSAEDSLTFDPDENEEEVAEEDEPSEDDAFFSSSGNLGSKTSVSAGGKFIGEFDTSEEAELALSKWMEKNGWFPNIWHISDHGNITPYSMSVKASWEGYMEAHDISYCEVCDKDTPHEQVDVDDDGKPTLECKICKKVAKGSNVANGSFQNLDGFIELLNSQKDSVTFSKSGPSLVIKTDDFTFVLKDDYKWGVMGAVSGYLKDQPAQVKVRPLKPWDALVDLTLSEEAKQLPVGVDELVGEISFILNAGVFEYLESQAYKVSHEQALEYLRSIGTPKAKELWNLWQAAADEVEDYLANNMDPDVEESFAALDSIETWLYNDENLDAISAELYDLNTTTASVDAIGIRGRLIELGACTKDELRKLSDADVLAIWQSVEAATGDAEEPKPRFKLGDKVARDDDSDSGVVERVGGYDSYIDTHRYQVRQKDGSRKWWNETNMKAFAESKAAMTDAQKYREMVRLYQMSSCDDALKLASELMTSSLPSSKMKDVKHIYDACSGK